MAAILFILFIVVPLVELAVIIQVGEFIGLGRTLVLVVAVSLLGAALVKREGIRAWRRFREALEESRIPAREVVDGALVLLGGALMLTPGFVTDAVGLLLVVPLTRRPVNAVIRRRTRAAFSLPPRRRPPPGPRPPSEGPYEDAADVIDVEVVNVERHDPPTRPES